VLYAENNLGESGMDLFIEDQSVANLVNDSARLSKRFGHRTALEIREHLRLLEAVKSFDQVAKFSHVKFAWCKTNLHKQICIQIDEKHAITFRAPRHSGIGDAEILKLGETCHVVLAEGGAW